MYPEPLHRVPPPLVERPKEAALQALGTRRGAGAVVVGSGSSAFRYVWGGLGGSFIPCQDSQKTALF